MATGIVWMVSARLLDRGIGVVSTLILARLLIPSDFGLVAMAMTIAAVLDLLGAFNFDLALIQKPNVANKHYDTVWTFNVFFGLFCGITLILLAMPAASFYRESRLLDVMYALALAYMIGGFTNVGIVNFRKDLHFRDEFVFSLFRRVVTFVVTIGGALWFRSYWALVVGIIVGRFAGLLASYKMSSYRPWFTLSALRELFNFSKWLLINNILFFLLHRGCDFVVGKLYGTTGLGIYTVSYEISNLPSTELVAPINRVTFPGFAKMTDRSMMASSYIKLLGMISLLILPVGVGIAAVAEPLILAVLGDKWVSAIPLIELLALYGVISATQTNNGMIWMVLGQPRTLTMMVVLFLLVLFPSLYFFMTKFGVIGAGYAYLIAHAVTVPISMWIIKKLLGFGWNELASATWRPIVAVTAMYIGVSLFDQSIATIDVWPRLIADSFFGVTLYAFFTVSVWFLVGRPSGAESFCIEKTCAALR